MAGGLYTLVGRLRRTLRPCEGGTLNDAELLYRWNRDQDQAAFELLVWRHGPLVLSVCQRLLSAPQDIEDAFQATFLILVRKAASISRRQALAAWLHTVAYRVALEARHRSARQKVLLSDQLDLVPVENAASSSDRELREVLDQEVQRLPEKYRRPFVLCCLEGRTNEEAARELGRPLGTILSQLSRARERLRNRLSRRGVTPALLGPMIAPPLPSSLVGATVEAALIGTNTSLAASVVKTSTAVLMEGALRAMLIAKLKLTATLVLAVVVLGAGGGTLGYRAVTAGESDPLAASGPGKAASQKEVDRLRQELKQAQEMIAKLNEALRKSQGGKPVMAPRPASRPTPVTVQGSPLARQPEIDRDDLDLLKVRAEAKRAELEAARLMAEEAAKRLVRMEKLRQTNAIGEDEVGAARVTLARYQAELRLREAELQEAMIHLKRADRLLTTTRPQPELADRAFAERLKNLEEQHATMARELELLRAAFRRRSAKP